MSEGFDFGGIFNAMMAASAEVLMEDMSIFADQTAIKEMLGEYMRRLVLARPDDPVEFLLREIEQNPVLIEKNLSAERPKIVDARSISTKLAELRELYDILANGEILDRGKFFVAIQRNPELLMKAFPKHEASYVVRSLEMQLPPRISWEIFSSVALKSLH